MNIKNTIYIVLFAAGIMLFGACEDPWKERTAQTEGDSSKNLLERLAADPSVSKFYEYVQTTGLNKVLESANTFMVWAPTNEALSALNAQSPNYLSDPVELKKFVQYHIGYLDYPVSTGNDTLRVQTLNGKFRSFIKSNLEEASITKADQYAKNGVYHVINKANPVKGSIWEIAHAVPGTTVLVNAMNSMDTVVTGSALIRRNPTWRGVADTMSIESAKMNTYFVLTDAAYNEELAKITPYYFQNSTKKDSTLETITKTFMLRDLLVKGLYTPDKLPDTLVSSAGVKIPVKKSAIVASYPASNGIVYLVNELPYRLKDRVRQFKIEGELWRTLRNGTGGGSQRGSVFNRAKTDSITGKTYYDVEAYNHGQSDYWIEYRVTNVNSVKYKVYARAFGGMPGDPQTVDFTQRYGRPNATTNANTNVNFTQTVKTSVKDRTRFNEVYLGDFTMSKFGTLDWRVLGASVTSVNVNTIILDYVRFEPILP